MTECRVIDNSSMTSWVPAIPSLSPIPIFRPMTADQAMRSDDLYRARWLSLLSVDDLVGEFVATLTAAGVVDNTYFLFTSDHGFRFGQYR